MSPQPPVFTPSLGEPWWPVPVGACARAKATLVRPAGGQKFLTDHDLKGMPADGGYLNFPADMRQPDDEPVTGYRRIKPGHPLVWVQWWLWYLYNPKAYPLEKAGWGAHEGDWELVQVGYSRHDTLLEDPLLVTASQHQTGQSRPYWDCETTADGRLIVYVARGSHANYLTRTRTAVDVADGEGTEWDDIDWHEFGSWASWPGRWGASKGRGLSPQSPGCQHERWNAPHHYYAKGRP